MAWGAGTTDLVDSHSVDTRSSAVAAWRTMRALTHHPAVLGRVHALGDEIGVTPTVLKALVLLLTDRPTPMRELATGLRCDNSYVTTVVDAMEKQGLAERRPHPTDRRIKIIGLTERGRELGARASARMDQPPASFAALTDEELGRLIELLAKLGD